MTNVLLSQLEQNGRAVLKQLLASGYEAYFVGGCVRDTLLNRTVNDYDIATSATPEEVMQCFERTVPTGIKHGTVTVLIDRQPFEVTTFRTETEYENYRRPKEVKYVTSLMEDLRRRDFTMNAMAMDIAGDLIDPFAGQADLSSGILRCVGIAEERFGEDALRMLRCVRFAADYGLRIEEATWDALCREAPLLSHIAMERVRAELERLVGGENPHRGIRMLVDSELPHHFKQALGLPLASSWSSAFAERALAQLVALPDASARWVLLLLLMEEETAAVSDALRKLTFSRAACAAISDAIALHRYVDTSLSQTESSSNSLETSFKLAVVAHGESAALLWLAVMTALSTAVDGMQEETSERHKLQSFVQAYSMEAALTGYQWVEAMPCKDIKGLAINGLELLGITGKKSGPWVAVELNRLLREVVTGSLPNDKAALLEATKQ